MKLLLWTTSSITNSFNIQIKFSQLALQSLLFYYIHICVLVIGYLRLLSIQVHFNKYWKICFVLYIRHRWSSEKLYKWWCHYLVKHVMYTKQKLNWFNKIAWDVVSSVIRFEITWKYVIYTLWKIHCSWYSKIENCIRKLDFLDRDVRNWNWNFII